MLPKHSSWSLVTLKNFSSRSFPVPASSLGPATRELDVSRWSWALLYPLCCHQLGLLLCCIFCLPRPGCCYPQSFYASRLVFVFACPVTHLQSAPLDFSFCDIFHFMNFDRMAEIMDFGFGVLDFFYSFKQCSVLFWYVVKLLSYVDGM